MKYIVVLFTLFTFSISAQNMPQEKIYRTPEVDVKPDLKDGMYSLTMFVSKNFVFPENVKNKKVKIFTSFIIEPNGEMKDIKSFYISVKDLITSDVVKIQTEDEKAADFKRYESMRTEASRVLSLFKETWTPAIVAGKPVTCLYNYPISFNIE